MNKQPHSKARNNKEHQEVPLPKYLYYEWSKGYLPTENPKADMPDLPQEALK